MKPRILEGCCWPHLQMSEGHPTASRTSEKASWSGGERVRPVAGGHTSSASPSRVHLGSFRRSSPSHIVGIGIVLASVFMIDLRIFGWAGRRSDASANNPAVLSVVVEHLLVVLLDYRCPDGHRRARSRAHELSFWLRDVAPLIGIVVATLFNSICGGTTAIGKMSSSGRWTTKSVAIVTFLVWCSIIVLGRLIAYDHVWGSWSLKPLT